MRFLFVHVFTFELKLEKRETNTPVKMYLRINLGFSMVTVHLCFSIGFLIKKKKVILCPKIELVSKKLTLNLIIVLFVNCAGGK